MADVVKVQSVDAIRWTFRAIPESNAERSKQTEMNLCKVGAIASGIKTVSNSFTICFRYVCGMRRSNDIECCLSVHVVANLLRCVSLRAIKMSQIEAVWLLSIA